jgi:hypothetical protein
VVEVDHSDLELETVDRQAEKMPQEVLELQELKHLVQPWMEQ